jgi:hypothetical protein
MSIKFVSDLKEELMTIRISFYCLFLLVCLTLFNNNLFAVTRPNLVYATPNVYAVGTFVTLTPTNSGGVPTSCTIASGSLPAGLSLSATGVISGTPTAVFATTSITVNAVNAGGNRTTAAFTITVNPSSPTGTDDSVCGSGTVTLAASGSSPSGGIYNWYAALSGGSSLATGTSYSPTVTATTTYYVDYTQGGRTSTPRTAVTATVNSAPVLATMPTTGVYFSYPFSGNANDISGSANTGTVQNAAPLTYDRYGAANSAYNFNGSTQYISTTNASASPGPQNFSISVWFKTSSAGGLLVGYGSSRTGSSSMYDRHIYMSDGGQIFFGLYPNAVKTISTTTSYADGSWHHAVATVSTTNGSNLYIDGALMATDAAMTTSQVYGANGYWRVAYDNLSGWTSAPSTYFFNGSLDDIAVYSSELTASQVYALYGGGSTPVCAGSALTLQCNTVAGASYSWTGPGGYSSSSQNPTVSGSATTAMAGTYTCTVTGSNGCTYSTDVTAVVNTGAVSTFTATSTVNVGSNATITYTGTDPSTSTYSWNFNGGSPSTGTGQGPFSVSWTTPGTKTITLTVTNTGGCSSTSTQTVIVGYGTYAFSETLTLNTTGLGITSNLTSFPALLSIQDNNLIISGTCTDKVYYPNGPNYDFAFVNPSTGSELYYQVESYNQTTGTLLVWVQIPTLTYATNNTITFYYGSTSPTVTHNTAFYQNTWASDYKAVFHFNESSYTGSVTDGTAGGHTGTTSGMTSADLVTGKIGTAYSFNGSSKKITANAVTITGSFTISAWVKLAAINIDQKIMTNQGAAGSSTGGYKLGVYTDNTPETESPAIDRSSTPTPAAFATGAWHYVNGVYTGSTLSTYVDGVQYKILTTSTNPSATLPLYLGVGEGGSQYYFNGIIDEARVSNVSKSSDWIKAEYNDQNNPASFTSVGPTSTNSTNAATISGALTYTWTGATSTDPTVAANWNNTTAGTTSQLPAFDGTATLVIPTGLTNYPSLTADESLYGLTIASGASLNLNGHTLSVGCNIYNSSTGQILYGSNNSSGLTWNGSAASQTYTGTNTSNTASLGSMTINNSSGGTVTISGGPVDIYKTLTLTSGNLVVGSSPAALTLKSTATQTASVAAIPSGSSITGYVTAERFVTGGSTYNAGRWVYRNYRLLSSPVNEGADASGNYPYSLNYIAANTIVTDCTSSFGSTSGNPSLYLYNETYTPNNTGFTTGNFIGVTNISNTVASGNITTTDAAHTSANVYAGDGVMMYFRGDKTTNIAGSPSKTKYPYVAPENVTFSTTGSLNQGTYNVVSWTGSAGLMYTTNNAGNATVRGYNLVGNPYASSIDWSLFSNTTSTAPIYGPNVNPTIYILNPTTNNFDTYNATTNTATGSAGNVIPSGQGFFVQASGSSPALTFKETAKTSSQVSGSSLLMGTPVAQNAYNSYLRLKLITDTINHCDMVIGFNSTSTTKYNNDEDSAYLPGFGAPQSISSTTSDSVKTSVKWLPLPKSTLSQVIKLNVGVSASGQYTLERTDFKQIPQIYEVWLMDRYKKDSLDIRNNAMCIFNTDLTDTASFGSNRFQVVIRENPALGLHLLDFTAVKATKGAQIIWKTENEQNYTNFTVERSNDGGTTFKVLGGIASSNLGTYSFLDKAPPVAADQYRLKLVDLNGVISYSNVVTLMYTNANNLVKSNIALYPNPAKSTLNLTITQPFNADASQIINPVNPPATGTNTVYGIKIVNSLGSVMQTASTNQQDWQTDVSRLMPGTYVIQVINNGNNTLVGKGTFIKL